MQHADEYADEENDYGQSGRITIFSRVFKGLLIDFNGDGVGNASRAATGQDPDHGDMLEPPDSIQNQRDHQSGPQARQRNIAETLPPVGAINGGSFIKGLGDGLQARQHLDHNQRIALPDAYENHAGKREIDRSQPRHRLTDDSQRGQRAVEQAG